MEELKNPLRNLFRHFTPKLVFADFFHELKCHPDYPTLKSISNTLEKFGIDNSPVRLKPEDLTSLDDPFLAYVSNNGHNELAYAHPLLHNKIRYTTEYKEESTIPLDEFANQFNGIAVLLDLKKAKPSVLNIERTRDQRFFGILITSIVAISIALLTFNLLETSDLIFTDRANIIFLITKIVGLTLTIALILKSLGESNNFLNKVCRLGKKADCNSVIKSKYATVYAGIKWSDLGLIYFLTSLYLLSINGIGIVTLMSLTAFPYVFVSLYQQIFIIKKICPLCLGVVTILMVDFSVVIISAPQFTLSIEQFLEFGLKAGLIGSSYLLIKTYAESRSTNTDLLQRYHRIKRIPEVVQTVLKREEALLIPPKAPIQAMTFGSKDNSKIKIQALLSLHCGHCGDVFKNIDTLIETHKNISVELYLSLETGNHSQVTTMENIVNAYYDSSASSAWSILRNWYQKPNHSNKKWIGQPSERLKKALFSIGYIMQSNQITSLPKLFIEGTEKSSHYNLTEYAEHADLVRKHITSKNEMIINT